MKYNRLFIPLILLCLQFNPAYSTDIFNSFYQECPSAGKIESNELLYSIDHIELLQERKSDTLLSRYTIRRQNLGYSQELKDLSFKINYSRHILGIEDLINNDYTQSNINPNVHSIEGKVQFKVGNYLLIPGLSFSYSHINDTLFVNQYPESEESIYNDYFFDLLPTTFGDSIFYKNTYNQFRSNLYIEKMDAAKGFSFYLDYSISNNKLNEKHWNQGDTQLRGPRESLMHFKTIDLRSQFSLKVDTNTVFKLGFIVNHSPIDWSHTVFPNAPDTLEIVKLSEGKTNLISGILAFEKTKLKNNFNISLQFGRINGFNHLATPVLGYVFGILPIAHQGDIALTTHYIQLKSHIDHSFNIEFIEFTPRLDLAGGYYFSHVSALALLQFGIEDIDIDKQYQHLALFASPGINTKFILNSELYMNLDVSQLLPFIKQIKPKPYPIEPDGIKRYGGLSVSLGVGMTW